MQTPKAFEALLVGTVPICHGGNAAYRKMKEEGWPLVLVEDWANVTETALVDWWAELAPAARRIRTEMTTSKMYDLLISGSTMGRRLGLGVA